MSRSPAEGHVGSQQLRIVSVGWFVHLGIWNAMDCSLSGSQESGKWVGTTDVVHSFTMALERAYQHSVNRQPLNGDDDEGGICVRV